jgi:hypothetical protein
MCRTRRAQACLASQESELQSFRPTVDLRGQKFVQAEQVENGVSDAHRSSELFAAARERDALFAFLTKANGYVGHTSDFVSLYLNVFFFERLEISRSCKTGKTSFERVFIKRLAFP